MTTYRVRSLLALLKRGNRFCTCCGLPALSPLAGEGTVTCDDCLRTGREAKHCRVCGSEVEYSTRRYFKDHNRPPPRFCYTCKPGAPAHMGKPHELEGVKVPREWVDVEGTVTVTGSGTRVYQAPAASVPA